MERLDKYLADSGAGTRSQVRDIIRRGRVSVDGLCVRDPAAKVDPNACVVTLDGQPVGKQSGSTVLLLNKPAGFVTSTDDPRDPTVMELLPAPYKKLNPVGRLDKQTEGLLLFTDDGALLHSLISPKKEIPKVYYARHEGIAGEEDVRAFSEGLTLRDGTLCRPAQLQPLGPGESLITVCEGKYHQVRRMMASRGMTVLYLERRREGGLELGDLPRGSFRLLTPEEVEMLKIAH